MGSPDSFMHHGFQGYQPGWYQQNQYPMSGSMMPPRTKKQADHDTKFIQTKFPRATCERQGRPDER
eukprot:scaffold20295_cov58-Phaeocystis_antarctica.AAC.1